MLRHWRRPPRFTWSGTAKIRLKRFSKQNLIEAKASPISEGLLTVRITTAAACCSLFPETGGAEIRNAGICQTLSHIFARTANFSNVSLLAK